MHKVNLRCFHTSIFGAHLICLDDVNTVFRNQVCTREPYLSPHKKAGLGYSSLLINTIVLNHRSEPLLMMYDSIKLCLCVFSRTCLTSVTVIISNFCWTPALITTFAVHSRQMCTSADVLKTKYKSEVSNSIHFAALS